MITSGAALDNAIVASDPRLPFDGTERSGYGREPAAAGIRERCAASMSPAKPGAAS